MEKESNKKEKSKKLNIILIFLLLIVICLKLLFFSVQINGNSMFPTYKDGEKYNTNIFIDRESINANTVITFWEKNSHSIFIKRVVATEGDEIVIKNGYLYVNGKKEDCEFEKMTYAGIAETPIIIGENEYFVLGDNRNNSCDSREIGLIKSNQIISVLRKQK